MGKTRSVIKEVVSDVSPRVNSWQNLRAQALDTIAVQPNHQRANFQD